VHSIRFLTPLLALSAAACGSYQEPASPSLLAGASYGGSSSSLSSFSGPSGPSIPSHGDARGTLVVRPDLACVAFVLRVSDVADPKAALGLLQHAVLAVKSRFGAPYGSASTLKMLGATVVPAPDHGKAKSDAPPRFVVTVDGSIEVPLAADADYWTRANIVSALVQASEKPGPLLPAAAEGDPEIVFAFGSPELKVQDPESFRAELVKRWVERARAFAHVAESEGAPLRLVACEPPNVINQTTISLEQVGLSLPVSCRIDVVRSTP